MIIGTMMHGQVVKTGPLFGSPTEWLIGKAQAKFFERQSDIRIIYGFRFQKG